MGKSIVKKKNWKSYEKKMAKFKLCEIAREGGHAHSQHKNYNC